MTMDFAALFEMYAEPVAVTYGGELIYCNQAAEKSFSKERLREILRLCEGAGVPSVCAVMECDVTVSEFQGYCVFRMIPNNVSDTADVFFKSTGNYLKNAMSNFQMASKYVVGRLDNITDSKLEKYLAMMNHSFFTVSYLTEEISRISESISDDVRIEKSMFDIGDAVYKLVHSVSVFAKGKAEVVFENRLSSCVANGDKAKLEIALLALISNSIKYTPESGKIKVTIEKKNNDIIITVSDTGCGIPADKLSTVFKKYAQKQEIPEPSDGLGVGLAYARTILEKHGGRIMIESRENTGTNVVMCIPQGIDDMLILKSPRVEYGASGSGVILRELSAVLDTDCYTSKFLD